MSTTGWPTSGPTRTGTPLGDVLAGLWQAIGILGAIQARNNTGLGQKVDIALVDSAVATMGNINMLYLSEGRIPGRIGNRYESAYPYDSFTCTDGSCVIGVANNKLWHLFCDIMEQPELAEDEKFCNVPDRVENHEELHKIVSEWAAVHTMTEVVDSCLNAGVPAAPIYNTAQVKADPHIAGDREMFVEQDHPKAGKVVVTGSPLKMSGTPVDLTAPAPTLGQHNEEVYGEVLGLDSQQVAELKSAGII